MILLIITTPNSVSHSNIHTFTLTLTLKIKLSLTEAELAIRSFTAAAPAALGAEPAR